MAEGFTSSYNPVTGERREHRFEYTPTPPPQPELVSPTQMSETYKYFLSKTNNPKAAIEAANLVLDAAKQYQGRMLYKRAQQNKTLTPEMEFNLGQDMFVRNSKNYLDMARANKIAMPETAKPNYGWTPPTNGVPGHFAAPGQRPVFAPQAPQPPRPERLPTITPSAAASTLKDLMLYGDPDGLAPQLREIVKSGVANTLAKARPATETATNAPATLSEQASKFTLPMPKTGDVIKGYRFKGGKPSDKNNWEKVQ